MSAVDVLNDLYDNSHGLKVTEIDAPSLGPRETISRQWEQIWRALKFDSLEPEGSSRLMEVAMALSAANGHSEMLHALFRVLETKHPINKSLEYFLKQLWIAAHVHREQLGSAFDQLRPVPQSPTARQAYLVVRFWWDVNSYSEAEKARLRAALADEKVTEIHLG